MRRLDRTARIQSELIVAIYCFVHQNFPGQYAHLVRHLADMPGNRVYFITQSRYGEIPGVRKLVYKPDLTHGASCHPNSAVLEAAVRTGVAVAEVCKRLRRRGVFPDIIVGHCGWGETLFVRDIWPNVPILLHAEFFDQAQGADVGVGPETADPDPVRAAYLIRGRRVPMLQALADATQAVTSTDWQASTFPAFLRSRIDVIHEGIDTSIAAPDASASLSLRRDGVNLRAGDEIV